MAELFGFAEADALDFMVEHRSQIAVETNFVRISEIDWNLSQQLSPNRRRRLKDSPPYEQIVEDLMCQMILVKVARERSRDTPDYFRAVVSLRVRAAALDIFYNAASGYRAQYYQDAALGTLANRFALDRLLPIVIAAVTAVDKHTCPPTWVEKSLRDQDAKLWPHQGIWLRHARKADQNLLVERWLARRDDPDKKLQKRARRSILTPDKERLLELKGGFLSPSGEALGTFKPKRSRDIHELGYT